MSPVSAEELAARHPRLFHMAEAGSWPSIRQRGLLSTSALLDLFEVPEQERPALEARRRPESVKLRHPVHGVAWLRDNKPVNLTVLRRTLYDWSEEQYFRALNRRVFLWLDRTRLDGLLASPSYQGRRHDLLELDTAGLLERHGDRVELSAVNSGAVTQFSTTPRGAGLFSGLEDYPWRERRRTAAELTVLHSLPDVGELVVNVRHG